MNDTPDARVLQGLYQHYLQAYVNTVEENTRLQVRITELEAAQEPDTDTGDTE